MRNNHRQRGAVLVVSLIILLVLTLIGVSAARTVLLEERMTFASRDAKVALEVAETLVRRGETYVDGINTTGDFGTLSWLHEEGEGPVSMLDPATWIDSNSRPFTITIPGPGDESMTVEGRLFIELAGNANKEDPADDITVGGYGQTTGGGEIKVFRVVALGRGINDATTRIVISHYGKRF